MERPTRPSGPVWSGLGVNYGSDVAYDNPFSTTQVTADLQDMQSCFTKVRVFIPNPLISDRVLNNCLSIINLAKQQGFKVVWGCTANPTTLTASNWQAYHDAVVSRAAIAETHDVDEFTIGNEDEYRIDGSTLSIATFRNNIVTLASDVRAVFSGDISYTVSHNHTFGWIAIGPDSLSSLDKLALNVYGSYPTDHRYFIYILSTFHAVFGDKMYVSEFNISDDWTAVTQTENEQKQALAARLDYIRRIGVTEAYYFIYSHRSDDQFALKLANGQNRAMRYVLTRTHDRSIPRATR